MWSRISSLLTSSPSSPAAIAAYSQYLRQICRASLQTRRITMLFPHHRFPSTPVVVGAEWCDVEAVILAQRVEKRAHVFRLLLR